MKRQIKTGLSGLNAAALVTKTNNIVAAMTGNASFPTPTPDLTAITAANTELKDAVEASVFGDKRSIQERDQKQAIVLDLVRQLAVYVTLIGNGDGTILSSSGFELRRLPEPMPPLLRPLSFVANRGMHEGTADLEWKSVRGSQSYIVEVSTSDPTVGTGNWTTAAITTKVKLRIENLTKGTYYWYRVMAVGRNSTSAYSDVSLLFAA